MAMDRRTFLKSSLYTSAGLFLGRSGFSQAGKIEDILSTKGPAGSTGTFLGATNKIFLMIDIASGTSAKWGTPCEKAHSVLLSPKIPECAVTIEQDGVNACAVNLKLKKTIASMVATNGHFFSGHGSLAPDGSLLFLAEFPQNKLDIGKLAVFETKNWKRIASYETGGAQ